MLNPDYRDLLSAFANSGVEYVLGRIDLLTRLTGLDSERVFSGAETLLVDGIRVPVIGLDDLIQNKRATGRPQDLLDAEQLERLRAGRT